MKKQKVSLLRLLGFFNIIVLGTLIILLLLPPVSRADHEEQWIKIRAEFFYGNTLLIARTGGILLEGTYYGDDCGVLIPTQLVKMVNLSRLGLYRATVSGIDYEVEIGDLNSEGVYSQGIIKGLRLVNNCKLGDYNED